MDKIKLELTQGGVERLKDIITEIEKRGKSNKCPYWGIILRNRNTVMPKINARYPERRQTCAVCKYLFESLEIHNCPCFSDSITSEKIIKTFRGLIDSAKKKSLVNLS
ncbi:MAG: hypothetical protein ACTSQA_00520 [Candidatus Heimdallarchaeaceae archaeon]